ncbi:hypothetical protein D5S17_28880 [Pseudonocardiaceae bacterium YIM PH 21723]|nr:hypothetical protein D5S17_28880 [Pseudonocardiaceae bacterium YIM PH 21723]
MTEQEIPTPQNYTAEHPDAGEWVASDNPLAEAFRLAGAEEARTFAAQFRGIGLATLRTSRTLQNEGLAASARELNTGGLEQLAAELSDTERHRRAYVEHRRAEGDPDYQYPAHLIGPGAADYPPPAAGWMSAEDRALAAEPPPFAELLGALGNLSALLQDDPHRRRP